MEIMTNDEEIKDKEIFGENDLMRDLVQKLELKIKCLEVIKDKLIVILNDCKCLHLQNIKQEVELLLDNYHHLQHHNQEEEEEEEEENQLFIINKNNIKKENINNNTIDIKCKTKLKTLKRSERKTNNRKKTSINEFICDWVGCDQSFNTKQKLSLHERRHKPIFTKKFKKLKQQQEDDEEEEEQHFDEDNDDEDDDEDYDMEKEKKRKYGKRGKYRKRGEPKEMKPKKRIWDNTLCPCSWPGCDKTFPTNNKLNCHLRVHTGEQPYACDWPDCHKKFHIKGSLKLHQNLHLRLKTFRCEWNACEESFSRIEQLDKHVYEAHTGKMPYTCDWPGCGYQTCYRQRLQLHKRKHTGEKPFKCQWPQCESSFTEAHHLKSHERKHTGERPYGCEWPGCERRYKNRQAMRFHMERTHKSSLI